MIKITKKIRTTYKTKTKNSWFDPNCKVKRKIFLRTKKQYLKNPTNQYLKEKSKQAANDYKKSVHTAKRNFDFKFERELREIKSNDPSAFWKLINKSEDKTDGYTPNAEEFRYFFQI